MNPIETVSNNLEIDFVDETYNGPTEQEIEDQMIERDIERCDADLRGENGPEAKAARMALIRHQTSETQEILARAQYHSDLTDALGSPVLAQACLDHGKHSYTLKLRSGEELVFNEASWHDNGWLTLDGAFSGDYRKSSTSDAVRYSVDVRLAEIIWVLRNPSGL